MASRDPDLARASILYAQSCSMLRPKDQIDAGAEHARNARFQKLLDEADPDGTLDPAEREKRARLLLISQNRRAALISAQKNKERREAARREQEARELATELDALQAAEALVGGAE